MDNTDLQIDIESTLKKLRHFYYYKDVIFQNIDAVLILSGKDEEKSVKIKTSAIHFWLFQIELVDTLMLFTRNNLQILADKKSIGFFKELEAKLTKDEAFSLILLEKEKDNKKNLDKMFSLSLKEAKISTKLHIGTFLKEFQYGGLSNEVETFLKDFAHFKSEIGPIIQSLYCIKNDQELDNLRLSAKATCYFINKLVNKLENYIDDSTPISHSQIAKQMDEMLNSQAKNIKKLNLNPTNLDFCFPALIQSGGSYDLRPNAESNQDNLKYDIIIAGISLKYQNYCSNVIRTLFINPVEEHRKLYEKIVQMYEYGLKLFRVNMKLNEIFVKVQEYCKKEIPEIADKFPTSIGFGIGLEFKENNLLINAKSDQQIEKGMSFIFVLGFKNIVLASSNKNFSVQIADTLVFASDNPEILTESISFNHKNVSYIYEETDKKEDASQQKTDKKGKEREKTRGESAMPSTSTKRTRSGIQSSHQEIHQQLENHQKQLIEAKLNELRTRAENSDFAIFQKKENTIPLSTFNVYPSFSALSSSLYIPNEISFDHKNFVIFFPFPKEKQPVPFHISMIKSVMKRQEGEFESVHFEFHGPNEKARKDTVKLEFPNGVQSCIKQISYRSRDAGKIAILISKVKEMQKNFKLKKPNEEEQTEQESFNLIKNATKPTLTNVMFRPPLSKGKCIGTLECHQNGFRFITNKSEIVEIFFKNIKHAIFQPCIKPSDDNYLIILHFNLKTPIRIGNKMQSDIQVCVEAAGEVETLARGRRGRDEDDSDDEKEELQRIKRKKLNKEFEEFVKKVEELTREKISFDMPFRELGFYGSHEKPTVFLQPTLNCLINIVEKPFFVMDLGDIEFTCFERINFGSKYFDLTFVKKDLTKTPAFARICNIPIEFTDHLKKWIDKLDIIFCDCKINLNWSALIDQVKEDPKSFIQEGGWTTLAQDSEDEADDVGSSDEDSEVKEIDFEEEESESDSEGEYIPESEISEAEPGEDEEDYDELIEETGSESDSEEEEKSRRRAPPKKKTERTK